MGQLDGKVAFITGAARGQGRSHAITLAREGADIIAVDLCQQAETVPYPMSTPGDLAETVKQVEALDRRIIASQADIRDLPALTDAVSRGVAELGRLDIVLANAGISTPASTLDMDEQVWDEMIEVNLTGVWKSAKAVAPHMIERQSGSIVITSSTNGLEAGLNYAHYVAAKHGVIGLMKNIALELAPYGIRCNSINPGAIRTPMTDHQGAWDMFAGHPGGTEADLIEGGYHFTALKGTSFMDPQVIADTALYLNSELAAKVTGVTIPVDAGHLILTGINATPVK